MDEFFHIFMGLEAVDYNAYIVVTHKLLTLVAKRCTQPCSGWGLPPGKTFGTASTMLDGCDEDILEQLTWAICDRVLCPGARLLLKEGEQWG